MFPMERSSGYHLNQVVKPEGWFPWGDPSVCASPPHIYRAWGPRTQGGPHATL